MPTALPLTSKISQSSNCKVMYRTLEAKFGNGYSQRSPDGLNNRVETWTILWENISNIEKDGILYSLDYVGGWDYLTWNSKKYKITTDGYTITPKAGDIYDVGVTLEQVFDV
jgi:phage-related protein